MIRSALLACALCLVPAGVAQAAFDDERRAGPGAEVLATGAGDDLLNGGPGADTLRGGPGDDVLVDTAGRDDFHGGAGDDRILAEDGEGGDEIHCGPGEDVAVVDAGDVVAADCETSSKDWPTRVRQDAKDLTAAEKADFVAALHKLKQTPSPYDAHLPFYDQFVEWHQQAFDGEIAHQSAAFLPWHREFLLQFENALQLVSGRPIALPYWDWTDPQSTAAVFADDLMGPNGDPTQGYAVTDGPFRRGNWRLYERDAGGISPFIAGVDQPPEDRWIVRAFNTYPGISLPSTAGVQSILDRPAYDADPFDYFAPFGQSFRNSIEAGGPGVDSHNSVHVVVGGLFEWQGEEQSGTMALATSPNDPVFWLHHNNIDRLWDTWSARNGRVYLPASGGPAGTNRDDELPPFADVGVRRTPGDLLVTEPLGYHFAGTAAGRARARASDDPAATDLHQLAAENGLICVL